MPRPPRTDAPGAVHHVMLRGVERRTIFASDADREDFLARLALLVRELGFGVLAWCLLGNHVHLVLKTADVPLAVLMARLNSRHAQRFNRQQDRVGHLFQDRYKGVRIEDDGALARCVAYVLGNPVRHRIIPMRALADHAWSGYAALVGRRRAWPFESVGECAAALGVERRRIESAVRREALAPGGHGAALEPDQIDELDRLIEDACVRHGVGPRALTRTDALARSVQREVCERAAISLDLSLRRIARRLRLPYIAARRFGGSRRPP